MEETMDIVFTIFFASGSLFFIIAACSYGQMFISNLLEDTNDKDGYNG